MALRDLLPFSRTETLADPLESALGHTPPPPEPGTVMPRVGVPYGQSGRANYYGLPAVEEMNRRLIGVEGLRRFDEMYRTDPHIRRLVLMAWAPIQAGTWTMEPHGGDDATDLDREVAETMWWALTKWMKPNLSEHLATVGPILLRSGFCPFEQIWAPCEYNGNTYLLPRKLDVRLPRSVWRWWQDDFGELTHIAQLLPTGGDIIIPASELVYYRLAPEGDNWVGTSLLRHAYKPWYMKDKLERIDVVGQERKAVGVPVCYPPKGADPATKQQVEQLLANLHLSEVAYLMMPGPKAGSQGATGVPQDEWLIDIIKFDSSSGEGIKDSLQYHKQGIESSFAQDFMALGQHQVGARATAEVQEDPYLTAVDALGQTHALPPLNGLIERAVEINWGDKVDGPPSLALSMHESSSLSEISSYLQQLVTTQVIQPDPELEDWARDHADMPPANSEIREQRLAAQKAGLEQAANPQPDQPPQNGQPGSNGKPPEGKPPENPKKPTPGGSKQLAAAEPSARWFDRLLSQDRLREAFDGCRDHIQDACAQPTMTMAQQLAYKASENQPLPDEPSGDLVAALTTHYQQLYALGHETVRDELQKQRQVLKTLASGDETAVGAAVTGSRFKRARQRGEHSARNIMGTIKQRLGRDQISGLKTSADMQQGAEQAATGALRAEALLNATSMVNDGRADAAMASSDVVGAYYTSVMDDRTCDPCILQDNGQLLSVDEAIVNGPPNPLCAGQDRCRCALVWVLSSDPAALAAVTGEPTQLDREHAMNQATLKVLEAQAEQQREMVTTLQQIGTPQVTVTPNVTPVFNVEPPNVTVKPNINVDAPPAAPRGKTKVIRDEDGRITGTEPE